MLVHIYGAKCIGIDAVKVTVEVDIDRGIGLHLVGLADVAVKESLLRTTTALASLGFHIPGKKIVINLAPADLHKKGSGYDIPIALGIIAASGQEEFPQIGDYIIMGELGLDGSIRDIPGALPMAELARESGFKGCILPKGSALEAAEFRDTDVFGVSNLTDVLRIIGGREDCSDLLIWNSVAGRQALDGKGTESDSAVDFSEIIGQDSAKRGAEIAAAGAHNLIMIGAPGAGKSSLAKAMTGILPPMSQQEAIVTSKIYSICGKGNLRYGLMRTRPFRAPHYSASLPAIIGGGGDNIFPGEVSLAQNGILFLDEVGQMPKSVIEALRGPLEDRKVSISRLKSKIEFPASFMLVAASNPCPCGYWGEGDRCTCSVSQRHNYISRLSGPLMDRIDIQLWLHTVDPSRIRNRKAGESSAVIAQRVMRARELQAERFRNDDISTNSEMNNKLIEKYCPLDGECIELMEKLMAKSRFSMRAYFRIIKVARTIADLEGSVSIKPGHLLEAAGYRFLDKAPAF